jgi:hypothetical protein
MTFEIISIGTPDRDAKVAECRRRSCGLSLTPTILPDLITIILAAS